MALPVVDNLHQTLMRFAERTNDLVCSANSNLERLVNSHCPNNHCLLASPNANEKEYSASLEEIIGLDGPISKKLRVYPFLRLGLDGPSTDATDGLTSIRQQKAPSLRPVLPVEILDGIFCLLTQQQLRDVLLSNSFLHQIARRRFYNAIVIRSPTHAIAFLKTILHNPELPALVRFFDISVLGSSGMKHIPAGHFLPPFHSASNSSPPLLTQNFYALVHRGLRAMHSLISLTLELPKSHSPLWIFDDCTFKLRQFTTSMHCNYQLANFLEKQDMIEELTLRGFQSESLLFLPFLGPAAALVAQGSSTAASAIYSSLSPFSFSLSPSALSRLKSFNAIHAGPGIIHTIMQDRSVEIASIPLFPERSVPALNALGSGKASLRRLSVISFDPGAPEFLFKELARRFKDLEALHLVLLMADYSNVSYLIAGFRARF